MSEKTFPSWYLPGRTTKPRDLGVTHASDRAMGLRAVEDLCESVGQYIDIIKIRTWPMQTPDFIRKKNKIYKDNDIDTSTGDYLEYVLLQGIEKVKGFLSEAQELGFTAIEVSDAIAIMPFGDKMKVVEMAAKQNFKVVREVGKKDLDWSKTAINVGTYIKDIRSSLDAGAWKIMIESQGLSEMTEDINRDFYHTVINEIGMKDLILEAGDQKSYAWFISEFSSDVNICINADQVYEAEHYRRGLRGRRSVFGRVGGF